MSHVENKRNNAIIRVAARRRWFICWNWWSQSRVHAATLFRASCPASRRPTPTPSRSVLRAVNYPVIGRNRLMWTNSISAVARYLVQHCTGHQRDASSIDGDDLYVVDLLKLLFSFFLFFFSNFMLPLMVNKDEYYEICPYDCVPQHMTQMIRRYKFQWRRVLAQHKNGASSCEVTRHLSHYYSTLWTSLFTKLVAYKKTRKET